MFSIKILTLQFILYEIASLPCIFVFQILFPKQKSLYYFFFSFVLLLRLFVCADEGSEVESEIEDMDENGEPQDKRKKTELHQVGCVQQPALESGVEQNLLNPLHNKHIVANTQTVRQCSATGNTYTAV